jgi:type II secretory pathway component GspD/PulD (secretin)
MALVLFFASTLFASSLGQEEDVHTRMVSPTRFVNEDIHVVLSAIFDKAKVHYTIHTSVRGRVTVNLPRMPLATALRQVLHTANATYTIADMVFQVVPGSMGGNVTGSHARL